MPRRLVLRLRERLRGVTPRGVLLSPLFFVVVLAVLVGGIAGEVITRAGRSDEVVVGNTGGSLSAFIRADGATIVVGGGNARTDLADLVGRSTVPWRRHIDLLIIPGWDDQQPIGALGLIERGGVAQVVIAGQPDSKPAWNVLLQAAANDGIPVNVVNGQNTVKVSDNVYFDLQADEPTTSATAQYTIVSLHYRQSLVSMVDVSTDGVKTLNQNGITIGRAHVLVEMRSAPTLATQDDVLLKPSASTGSQLGGTASAYSAEIRGGQRITIRLSPTQLRMPLDAFTATSSTPPTYATSSPTAP